MPTLLVIDDDADVLGLIHFVADREGYRILEAKDGKEGLEMAYTEKPDLIIMDIMMPEMDGLTATLRLSADETTRHIPIIILTAKGNMRKKFETLPSVKAYVEKPFEPKELSEIIRTAVK